jgi:hypothetical protein
MLKTSFQAPDSLPGRSGECSLAWTGQAVPSFPW